MEQLTSRDLRRALDLVRGIYATNDFDGLVARLLSSLPALVPSEVTSYNRMRPSEAQSENWVAPKEVDTPARARGWERVMHQHPNLLHYDRTGDMRALRVSDFLSSRQLRGTALYNEHYRPLDVEDCLTLPFPGERGTVNGIALHRSRQFSEHDKLIVECLSPHLCQAYRNALAVNRLLEDTALFDRTLASTGRAIVALKADRRIRFATAWARKRLEEYFDAAPAGDNLPESLEQWVRRHETGSRRSTEMPLPREALVVSRNGNRLLVRLISEFDHSTLLFEEQRTSLELSSLVSLGLTQREAQVLATAAGTKKLHEIGTALGISPRTVQTHLQAVYRKLNVESRSAAVAAAFRASVDTYSAVHTRDDRDSRAYLDAWLATSRSEASETAQGRRS